jgi:small subunit ribosomal protein S6e
MVEIKLAIGSKEEKKVFKHVVSGADSEKLFGKKIGESFHGEIIGLTGYELQITGGSDNSGFPMRKDVGGQARKRIIITKGIGFNTDVKGQRKRVSIRGNTISGEIAQINCKVVKVGKDKIAKILGGEPKEEKAEAKPTEAPVEKKEEPKAEEKPASEAKPEEKKEAPKVEQKPAE